MSIVHQENQKTFLHDLPSHDWISGVAPTCRHFAQLILDHLYSHLTLSRGIAVDDLCGIFHHLTSLKSITFVDWEDDLSRLTWAIWFDLIQQNQISLRTFSRVVSIRFNEFRFKTFRQ